MAEPMRMTSHKFPEQMIKAVKAESKRTGLTASEIVRRAIDAYLKRK